MTQEKNIQKTVELVLSDIEKVSSTGLYNGKAGLSLSLFIAAEYLQDEQLEDTAYNLLQESLVIKNYDVSFENGLAGIGYVLCYLIENKYLEADFDEIFGMQYETLVKSYENIEKDPSRLVNSLQAIYFLSDASRIKKEDERIPLIIKKIFEGLELFLSVQFFDFLDIRYTNNKAGVLNIYTTYLKLIDYSGFHHFSYSLLEDYAALYRKGRITSSLETGFYLDRITGKYEIKGYEDIISEHIDSGIKNIYPSTLSLRERINLAKITNSFKYKTVEERDLLPEIENIYNEKRIHDLLKTVDEKSFPFGYGAGLGRLLIYCVNKQTELL